MDEERQRGDGVREGGEEARERVTLGVMEPVSLKQRERILTHEKGWTDDRQTDIL